MQGMLRVGGQADVIVYGDNFVFNAIGKLDSNYKRIVLCPS